jgi:peptidoglycan/xylan/chitin deacetylase (PgdA/CDA1 family)
MFTYTIPLWLQSLFSGVTWKVKTKGREVYITFDDGPHPEITPWVLQQLDKHNAKATFFCVGDNVRKYPDTYKQLLASGHKVGNHTFNHLNGWKTRDADYIENVKKCSGFVESKLFRPPYGRITFSQIRKLRSEYRIIMWDILTGDFNKDLKVEQRKQQIKNTISPGSVLVFHDSEKAEKNLKLLLPDILDFCVKKEFTFERI